MRLRALQPGLGVVLEPDVVGEPARSALAHPQLVGLVVGLALGPELALPALAVVLPLEGVAPAAVALVDRRHGWNL